MNSPEVRAEQIVRALAEVEDPAQDGHCILCNEHEHPDYCPWKQATEFVAGERIER